MKKIIMFLILGLILNFNKAQAQMVAPTAPTYETCQQTAVSDGNGGTIMQTDQACLNRNAQKQRNYNAAMDAFNRGTRMADSAQTTTVNRPAEPVYENCSTTDPTTQAQTTDFACQSRNLAKQRDYQIQMSGYNEALRQQQIESQKKTAQQEELARQQQLASSKALAESAQQKNEKSSSIYQLAAMGCAAYSAYQAAMYAASCGTAGCTCMQCLAESIAFAIFSGMANSQAGSNDQVAHNACVVASKVSADGGGCGAPPSPPPNPNDVLSGLFNPNGQCIGDPAKCNEVTSNLPPGTNIKDVMKGISTFASSNSPFKVNSDGTVIRKDGKTFKPSAFSSEADLVAAGFSPAEAKAIMAKLKSNGFDSNSISSIAAARLKDLKNSSGSGGLDANNTAKTGEATLNGKASGEKDIGGGKRGLASAEGLARDFNGELIGVAGDDIFKMMNRRYKLKTSQDAFIGP